MAGEKYTIPQDPAYRVHGIRAIQDSDLADACQTFNPVIEPILESVEYLNRHKAKLDETGKVPDWQLPDMDYIPAGEKAKAGGVATLDGKGKVPSGQLPAMDYLPANQKAAANGVASLDANGKVPTNQLPALGGHIAQATAPSNTNLLWVDTSNDNLLKFYDSKSGTWQPVKTVWG